MDENTKHEWVELSKEMQELQKGKIKYRLMCAYKRYLFILTAEYMTKRMQKLHSAESRSA